MYTERQARARQQMRAQGLDGLLITQPENRRYLTGFTARDSSPTSSAGWVLLTPTAGFLLTSFLYYEAALAQAQGVEVVQLSGSLTETTARLAADLGLRRLGFEAAALSFATYRGLQDRLGDTCTLVPTEGLIEDLRAVKDPAEVAAIRRAVALADQTYAYLREILRPGMTEARAAWLLEAYMREHGAEGMAFEPTVAAGPHSAIPHHQPTERPIGIGEPVWVDFGARVDGYCSDITRSFVLGPAPAEYRRRWELVRQAQEAALAGLRPGLSGREADALARQVLEAAGYGAAFGHSLGHGIGLAVHERPRLSRLSEEVLAPGMTVTVEPGLYLPGWGGIRHEDLVVITAEGIEVLTQAPKELAWPL